MTSERRLVICRFDELEPVERDTQSYRPTWSLFYWPLGIALVLAALLALASLFKRRWR